MDDIEKQTAEFSRQYQGLTRMYEECARAVGLSYSALHALGVIYVNKNTCTQKMIREETFLPKQTVNAIVRGFWKDGYVKLVELDADRRNKTIHLTKAGRAFADKIVPVLLQAEVDAMTKLTDRERKGLIQGSYRYMEHLRETVGDLLDIDLPPIKP